MSVKCNAREFSTGADAAARKRTKKRTKLKPPIAISLAGALMLLSGCAYHNFAPGPGMSAFDFEPDSARCRLFARGANPDTSFEAYGSERFVAASMAGAAIGSAIGDAVRGNANYNDCMEARGWRIADGANPIAPTLPVGGTDALEQPQPTPPPSPQAAARRGLGLRVDPVADQVASALQISPPRGLVILEVIPGGAGEAAGLVARDVILTFAQLPITSVADMQRALASVAANSSVTATIWHNREERTVSLRF